MARPSTPISQIEPEAGKILRRFLNKRPETNAEIARSIGIGASSDGQIISQWVAGRSEIPAARLFRLSRLYSEFPLIDYLTASYEHSHHPMYALALEVIRRVEMEYVAAALEPELEMSDRASAIALEDMLAEDQVQDPDLGDAEYAEICRMRRKRNKQIFKSAMEKHRAGTA